MAQISKIEIEFTTNTLAVGSVVSFDLMTTPNGQSPNLNSFDYTAVPVALNANFFSIPTAFTSIVGEAIAQNYYAALVASSNSFPFVYSINENIVTIFVYNTSLFSYDFSEGTFNDSSVVMTIQNDVEDADYSAILLDALNIKHLAIEIIDTYSNTRILANELAQSDACILEYNAGDTMYESIMSSNLKFNMAVLDKSDGFFIHLLTGDENRYLVNLKAIDVALNEQLIWAGYILPDQYSEPYTNSILFVDFTATDMLSVLKGKYFPIWYYNNAFPVGKLLTYLLRETGLIQNVVVFPSIVPESDSWDSLVVDIRSFESDGKLSSCYDILSKFLKAQGLILTNYRGYWMLEGITRRKDEVIIGYQFDENGDRINDLEIHKEVKEVIFSQNPTLTAVTPWKKVNINFEAKASSNLFSDEVIKIDPEKIYKTFYSSGNYSGPSYTQETFKNIVFRDWIVNLSPNFLYAVYDQSTQIEYRFLNAGIYYNLSEAQALNNYLECKEQPYVKPGITYQLEAQFKFYRLTTPFLVQEEVNNMITAGGYDLLVCWQLFLNGVERYSNRPGMVNDANVRYKTTVSNPQAFVYDITYTLKFTFKVDTPGYLKFRLLMPISTPAVAYLGYEGAHVKGEMLKLTTIEGYDALESLQAVRSINYTQELPYDISMTSTVDTSVMNSFRINRPTTNVYENVIDRTNGAYSTVGYHYFSPATALLLNVEAFSIPRDLYLLILANNLRKNCFMQNGDTYYSFLSMYGRMSGNTPKLAYLDSYVGFPVLPKDYKSYPGLTANDVLKIFHIPYGAEDLSKRDKWRIFDSADVDVYVKILANALHAVTPEVLFRLEGTAKALVFPFTILDFYYSDENKDFTPTTLRLNLYKGQTELVATELKFQTLNDISYE